MMLAGAGFVLLLLFQLYLWVRLGNWVPVNMYSVVGPQGMAWVDHFTVPLLRTMFLRAAEFPLLLPLALAFAGSAFGVRALRQK
ncbi:MAG TPA: hypothetical protein VJ934_11540 [Desulfomicrobiaceae bacterium]|nr:hypothetical protein [Desulfomicrobiaceae bacterium]